MLRKFDCWKLHGFPTFGSKSARIEIGRFGIGLPLLYERVARSDPHLPVPSMFTVSLRIAKSGRFGSIIYECQHNSLFLESPSNTPDC